MTQYAVSLLQNVASSGIEWDEKLPIFSQGGLLTANQNNEPVVLTVPSNSDGHALVIDSANALGLKWSTIPASHTQNTDLGTTNSAFYIGLQSAGSLSGSSLRLANSNNVTLEVQLNTGELANIEADEGLFNRVTIFNLPTIGTDGTNKTYVDGLIAGLSTGITFKGTIYGSPDAGNYTVTQFNAIGTYSVGWQYRIITNGLTVKGFSCNKNDLLTCISGTGTNNSDWSLIPAGDSDYVVGPSTSTTNYPALFDGSTGKLIKQGSAALGLGAYQGLVTVDSNSHTNSGLTITNDNPQVLSLLVASHTQNGALSSTDWDTFNSKIGWSNVPANYNSDGVAGQMAHDLHYLYICTTTGTGGNGRWSRSALANVWAN